MPLSPNLWIRREEHGFEYRAPLAPDDARALTGAGVSICVEESPERCFDLDDYRSAGCTAVPAGSWPQAPSDHYILGLKALPPEPGPLAHRHIYFGHAFKGQPGSAELLSRFAAGGGELLDLEHLVDHRGRRFAAFGYWAGFLGAALAVLQHRGRLEAPLRHTTRAELERLLRPDPPVPPPTALVVGALGRCGTGARDALAAAGITPTCWDLEETRRLDRDALLAHDILVNAVSATRPDTVLVREADLDDRAARLRVIADVTCDVGVDCNALPIYRQPTTWQRPWTRLREAGPGRPEPLDLIAIDNLPSLLPAESSSAFSAQLAPLLARLAPEPAAGQRVDEWQRCGEAFRDARAGARSRADEPKPDESKEPIDV